MITRLGPNQIFVFGSNLAGLHNGGAARQAHEKFEAKIGIGEGLTGRSYAFPTLDSALNQLHPGELERSRDNLYRVVRLNPDKEFLLTKVGCGIAGFPEKQMRALFKDVPSNVTLPPDWL